MSLLNQYQSLNSQTLTSLAEAYESIRSQTESLVQPLSDEDCSAQSMPDASPAKWHLAHTSWFFETFLLIPQLVPRQDSYKVFNPDFQFLFNSYYNGVGEQFTRAQRGLLTRPTLTEILSYRNHVDQGMSLLFDSINDSKSHTDVDQTKDIAELIELGLNHEQQHQELLLTDIKHLFSINPLLPAYETKWPLNSTRPSPMRWIRVEAQETSVGHCADTFCFDNETPKHSVRTDAFELASQPVSNGEFIEFILDGGYSKPELWLSNGWAAVQEEAWQAPMYWHQVDLQWRCFTLHGDCPVDLNAPVCHVSFYEAEAYARWSSARLLTEFEWEAAAQQSTVSGNFLESDSLHPISHNDVCELTKAEQLFGDVWEWTRSDYAPYPGFAIAQGAVGEYNGKFMSDQYVLRGGSCVTPIGHIRSSYRNFFPAGTRWQFSGIRLARDIEKTEKDPKKTIEQLDDVQPAFFELETPQSSSEHQELIAGLMASPAQLSPKYFYDFMGSKLFEAITCLPEYYQTRTEKLIFEQYTRQIADSAVRHPGADYQLADLGAGNCEKAAALIPSLKPSSYVAIDVSAEFLKQQVAAMQKRFPNIVVSGVAMDFSKQFRLPKELKKQKTLMFYPGSSLGNFPPAKQAELLSQLGEDLGDCALLLGLDLVKGKQELEAAYDDALGVTAAFNLNALRHVNQLIGSNFDAADWRHVALFNVAESRIEMHLEAKRDITVALAVGQRTFATGERILTEYSHKWPLDDIAPMLESAGYTLAELWTDPDKKFAVCLAVKSTS